MPIHAVCVCDDLGCGKVIESPDDGFIIEGNIYAAHPTKELGIIGNNFPNKQLSEISAFQPIIRAEIHKSVYCRSCFLKSFEPREE